ncbi:MAG: hypothetical protein O3B13_11575 [Planctomycetota bacterium]|nr:hypothetical protein [Planctomycetota bacterium]
MMLAAIEFVEWLASTFDTTTEAVALALWVSLLAGLLFVTIHFLTMMVTRWGDSEPTGQAFMCSVLLHLSLAFGAVAVTPPERLLLASVPERVQIRQIVQEGEEPIEAQTSGNTPVWERLLTSPSQKLSRSEQTPLEFEPLESPERRPEPITKPDMAIPDVQSLPEMPVWRPEPRDSGDVGRKVESAAPLRITDSTAEAKPDINIPSLSTIRRSVQESGLKEVNVDRKPNRGSVDRIVPDFDATRQLAALNLTTDPTAFLERGITDEAIQRRTAPAPSALKVETPGTVSDESTAGSMSGAISAPKFSRLQTRTPKMEEFGDAQRFRPDLNPQSQTPIPSPVVAVRDGLRSPFPTDVPQPNIIRPNSDPIDPGATTKIPPTYRLRTIARRQETARRYGGTDESERAVEASLQWLALHQNPAGYWDADGFSEMCPEGDRCTGRSGLVKLDEENVDRQNAGLKADAGVTGLAILAFLGAGYTHEEGQYADQVDRALGWLIREQQTNGFFGGQATRYAQMYCHAIATYAMAEALGMQTDRSIDRRLRQPLSRAIAYIIDAQNPTDGGWRYLKGQRSDMSMFGWQLMALKSAEIAGIEVPVVTRERLIQFLRERSLGQQNGLASYRVLGPEYPPLPPTPSMTAEALFCKQMLGLNRANPQSIEGINYLMQHPPDRKSENLYYWYYGTLAVYQYGGSEWRTWNNALRDHLVDDQRTTGHAAGSWDPKAPWGPYGGRVFSTALSTLCLEVYYRFLPLYQIGDELESISE